MQFFLRYKEIFVSYKKGKAFTWKSELRQHGCWSQTPSFLSSHTHWQLPLTSTHKRSRFLHTLTVQMDIYPSMCPTRTPSLTALCTLKVPTSFHYAHVLCVSYYVPAKSASLIMYQQKSRHFSMQLFCVKSVFCGSISIIISCSHQNLQSYGTMMRNLSYVGKTTKTTFFLLLTTSCLPKHNWKSSISPRNKD